MRGPQLALLLPLLLATLQLRAGTASVCPAFTTAAPPPVVPLPKQLELTPFTTKCANQPAGMSYENTNYSDGNGPRGALNASDCCARCAAQTDCQFWSFVVDPAQPTVTPGNCRWGALSYCCLFHTSGANLTKLDPTTPSQQFAAKGHWQSGSIEPALGGGSDPTSPLQSELVLGSAARVVALSPELQPLAALLSDDILHVSGRRFPAAPAGATAANGDITLGFSSAHAARTAAAAAAMGSPPMPKTADESYKLVVTGKGAAVQCTSYVGCAWGASTLLQLLCVSGVATVQVAVPAVTVTDEPDVPYRGTLVDVARSLVTPQDLRQAIDLARMYKIRFVHLHFTDDHAWTFPSDAFPLLGSQNVGFRGQTPAVFRKQDLVDLVAYADVRGVTLVPELEGPGHSSAQRRAMPLLFGPPSDAQGGGVLTVTNESVYAAMTTIIQEMAAVFVSSPYIHIGCDETSTPTSLPGYDDFAKRHNIANASDLFAYYVKYMADAVRGTKKTAIVWGPASLTRLLPGDAVVMVWNGGADGASDALARGLQVINNPNEGGTLDEEYAHDLYDFSPPTASGGPGSTVESSPAIIGSQVNIWECGWGYAQAARPGSGGASTTYNPASVTSFVQQAVARTAGAWWAGTWPRNASNTTGGVASQSFIAAYSAVDHVRFRLQTQCAAAAASDPRRSRASGA